jgi:hypothetical protein
VGAAATAAVCHGCETGPGLGLRVLAAFGGAAGGGTAVAVTGADALARLRLGAGPVSGPLLTVVRAGRRDAAVVAGDVAPDAAAGDLAADAVGGVAADAAAVAGDRRPAVVRPVADERPAADDAAGAGEADGAADDTGATVAPAACRAAGAVVGYVTDSYASPR